MITSEVGSESNEFDDQNVNNLTTATGDSIDDELNLNGGNLNGGNLNSDGIDDEYEDVNEDQNCNNAIGGKRPRMSVAQHKNWKMSQTTSATVRKDTISEVNENQDSTQSTVDDAEEVK